MLLQMDLADWVRKRNAEATDARRSPVAWSASMRCPYALYVASLRARELKSHLLPLVIPEAIRPPVADSTGSVRTPVFAYLPLPP